MNLKLRNGHFYLQRRVPKRFHGIESRRQIWQSLKARSKPEAEAKAAVVWNELLEGWQARLDGLSNEAQLRFHAAQRLAATHGFRYRPATEVAELPQSEFLSRVKKSVGGGGELDEHNAPALLGTVPEPAIALSQALELYWGLSKDKTLGKTTDQIRRWRNPRIKAIRNLIAVVGDKDIRALSRDDMLDFRDWWLERIEVGEVRSGSGNKDLTHIGSVLKTVNEMKRLGIDPPLSGLSFKLEDAERRPPFSDEWIKVKLLAGGALAGLNSQARSVLLGMINTGCRPSEITGLLPQHIRLDGPIPFIDIKPEGRQLKTRNAERRIPLTGVSLEAFETNREGFPRYRNQADLSATVNGYLKNNHLMETPKHKLYSLRHSFEDRLLDARVDERIRCDLLGHAYGRVRYGDGATMERVHQELQSIAL